MSEDPLYRVSQVARHFGRSSCTVRRWIDAGWLEAERFGDRGHYRVRLSALKRFVQLWSEL